MTPTTEAGKRLLDELAESPLPGARYARDVVSRRIAAIEAEARAVTIRELDAKYAARAMSTTTEALGNDKGWEYAVASRVGSLLDEAVISGVLSPEECRSVHVAVGRPVDLEAEARAAALRDLREQVEGLRVKSNRRNEGLNPWLDGFRASRNETVISVLAIIDRAKEVTG
jgi:hypothetical protein